MRDVGVWIFMLLSEVMMVGRNTLSKAATSKGMSNYVYVTYTHVIGFFILLPIAFLIHRKTPIPSISSCLIWRMLLLAVILYCCSILLFIGISYSSPTLASAMNNLSPALTFIIAIIFRMEKLNLRAQSTLFKLVGTIVSITGAFIVTYYQGFPIKLQSSSSKFVYYSILKYEPNWVIGGFLLAINSIFLSLSYIVKTWVTRDFHCEVVINLISFFVEAIIAALVTLIAEKDKKVWIPSTEIDLIAIITGAVVVTAISVTSTWACRKKGPLFVAMFRPVEMIIAAVMGVCFLKDVLYFGRLVGGIIIALGFYMVMKGKADEEMLKQDHENRFINSFGISEPFSDQKAPLLENKNMDV